MDKNSWIHTLTRLILIYTFTDLFYTYMNNNSWIHTLTKLIGFIHGQDMLDTYMGQKTLGYTH